MPASVPSGGSIRAGTGYVVPTSMFTGEYTPTAAFPPLYPAYQALWQSVFDAGPTSVRMAGMVPAAATITLTAILGRRAVGPRVGLAAAAIVAVHPGLIAADGSAMSESLTVPLVLAAQLLALCLADSGHGRLALAVALGPVLGLAILTRQDLVLFGGILALDSVSLDDARQRRRHRARGARRPGTARWAPSSRSEPPWW